MAVQAGVAGQLGLAGACVDPLAQALVEQDQFVDTLAAPVAAVLAGRAALWVEQRRWRQRVEAEARIASAVSARQYSRSASSSTP
ncbi:hypothetical protein G039_0306075 [Pseudomonas aeruginosa VRFPA01]|nr:hypothetical protein G039_0306075 [Pseudomonas aeruginosa VRFPA01]